jgi:salicylate hydroxylase
MAVEDGLALSRSLTKITHPTSLAHALQIFEKVRISRATKMQEASLLNGKLWHFPDGPVQRARDRAMRPEVVGGIVAHSPNQWTDPATQMWAYGYDAEGEIDRIWEEVEGGVKCHL